MLIYLIQFLNDKIYVIILCIDKRLEKVGVIMKGPLKTPFGNVKITLNNSNMDYNYTMQKKIVYNKEINIYSINIDLYKLKVGDKIKCEIDSVKLEYNDGDEMCDLLSVEDEDLILGFCGIEPQYHDITREWYCFELYEYYGSGYFLYKVYKDPKEHLNSFKDGCTIWLKICWVNKKDFKEGDEEGNCDDAIFRALC